MWKRAVAAGLERATRVEPVRRMARQASRRGYLPVNAQQFMHVQERFTVRIGGAGQTFEYGATDADAVGRHLFWSGLDHWEAESWREFVPIARSARGFLDIGAFTGCYSLVAATVNPRLRAIAFEPVPGVYERLVHNVALNGLGDRTTTVPAAVSSAVGTARFYVPDREMPDTGFLETSLRRSQEAGRWQEVLTTTVAAALPADFPVDVVKIDVEDAEGHVVTSMLDVLAAHRPVVFIELLATGSYAEAVEALSSLGYCFFHLTAQGRVPVERPTPVPGARYFNYLCVPPGGSP